MKMSTFPLPVSGYPNLASTQFLMSAAGGLNLSQMNSAGSPKEGSTPTTPQFPGLPSRLPSLGEQLASAGSSPTAASYLPPQLAVMAGMADPRLLYSALQASNCANPYEAKENAETLMAYRHLAAQVQAASSGMLPYESHAAAAMAAASFPYAGYPGMDLNGVRRKNATRETTSTLKAWLYEHRKNPYPTKGEKIMLAIVTKMTLTQVSTWFANARRRLKKENKMTWSPRNRTDDGSDDGDEKADDENADDDVSIDLSDFESEASPTKSAEILSKQTSTSSATAPTQSPVTSHTAAAEKTSSKPRIWSIADVAASKPSQSSTTGPIHHQPASLRHKPYPSPNTSSFRPWFDNAYRPLTGHPIMGNPLIPTMRPNINHTSLRIPIAHSLPQTTQLVNRSPLISATAASLAAEKELRKQHHKLDRETSLSPNSSHRQSSVSPTESSSSH